MGWMGTKILHCLDMFESIMSIESVFSFQTKKHRGRTFKGEYDVARRYMCARSAGFWSGAQWLVGGGKRRN